jgi:Flp pilus assembly pilin Flp
MPSCEEGATTLEYALLAFLVAVACATAVSFFGQAVGNLFAKVHW